VAKNKTQLTPKTGTAARKIVVLRKKTNPANKICFTAPKVFDGFLTA
jgi:hypothetical protein